MNTDKSLENQVAVITGGASGMGRAIAKAFVAAGAKVSVGDINESGLSSLQEELGESAVTVRCDVTREEDIVNLISSGEQQFGRIDIGVNCAGASVPKPIFEIEAQEWDDTVALNLKGLFLALKHEAKAMASHGQGGVIINMTSVTASLAAAGLSHYSSAKAGANQLVKVAANEFRDLGIRVIGLAPGLIRTPLAQMIWDNDLVDAYNTYVPSGRAGEADEVAAMAVFLASKKANFINGSIIFADGGHASNGGWTDLAGINDYYREL